MIKAKLILVSVVIIPCLFLSCSQDKGPTSPTEQSHILTAEIESIYPIAAPTGNLTIDGYTVSVEMYCLYGYSNCHWHACIRGQGTYFAEIGVLQPNAEGYSYVEKTFTSDYYLTGPNRAFLLYLISDDNTWISAGFYVPQYSNYEFIQSWSGDRFNGMYGEAEYDQDEGDLTISLHEVPPPINTGYNEEGSDWIYILYLHRGSQIMELDYYYGSDSEPTFHIHKSELADHGFDPIQVGDEITVNFEPWEPENYYPICSGNFTQGSSNGTFRSSFNNAKNPIPIKNAESSEAFSG